MEAIGCDRILEEQASSPWPAHEEVCQRGCVDHADTTHGADEKLPRRIRSEDGSKSMLDTRF
ncbi:hypothetical protein FM104_00870 [Microbacterium esteraromaticum]|uniref:Uncharacterized protein n=1 Tax=Microbacterium esteraromaticum TaxID=57043 RepID=A0A1R4I968_9MICO|nr:hypothetical protein FM104_00870 [Microbacterium esteraromaticum]